MSKLMKIITGREKMSSKSCQSLTERITNNNNNNNNNNNDNKLL